MTSVRPLASLCWIAASTRSTRASPMKGAPPVALALAVAFTVPWYTTFGVRPAVSVPIGRSWALARAVPAGFIQRRLAAEPRHLAMQAQRFQLERLGARHHFDRRVELKIDVGGVVDEKIADGSLPHTIRESAFAGQMQSGLASERIGPDDVIRGRAVERGIELRQRALIHLQAGNGDVAVRSPLPAPVEVDIGHELVELDHAGLDATSLGAHLDDRCV